MSEELEKHFARKAAQGEITVLDEIRGAILAQHLELFKWITASLLTVNGAAAVALMQATNIDLTHKLCAFSNFSCGMFFSLLVGVLAQKMSSKTLRPIQVLKGYWLTVEVDGIRDEDIENELQEKLITSSKNAWIIPAIGWVSAAFFAAGLFAAGHGMEDTSPNDARTTPSVQAPAVKK